MRREAAFAIRRYKLDLIWEINMECRFSLLLPQNPRRPPYPVSTTRTEERRWRTQQIEERKIERRRKKKDGSRTSLTWRSERFRLTDRKALLTRATMQARSACAAPSKAALGARKVRLGGFFLGGGRVLFPTPAVSFAVGKMLEFVKDFSCITRRKFPPKWYLRVCFFLSRLQD